MEQMSAGEADTLGRRESKQLNLLFVGVIFKTINGSEVNGNKSK